MAMATVTGMRKALALMFSCGDGIDGSDGSDGSDGCGCGGGGGGAVVGDGGECLLLLLLMLLLFPLPLLSATTAFAPQAFAHTLNSK